MDTLTLTLQQRWLVEANRLRTYRRQRALVHTNAARPLCEIVADAEDLDVSIGCTLLLMDECCDEVNAATPGTWTYAQVQLQRAIEEPA